eukprot:gene13781-15223_t
MNETTVSVPTTSSPVNIVQFSFAEKIVMSCLLTVIILVGLVGNSLVCIIFVQNKNIRTIANCFIVNLAFADILQSATITFMIVSLLNDGWVLGNAACQLTGFMNVSFIVTSLFSLAIISVQRYITVVRKNSSFVIRKKQAIILVVVSWLFPAFIAIAPILGWSAYRYRPGKLMCTLQFSYNVSYTLTAVIIGLLAPFATICVSSYKIMKTVRDSANRVGNSSVVGNQRRKHEVRVSMMLLGVIVCFIIFYMPASIVNFIQLGNGDDYILPYQVDAWTVILAMLNHANNPIIYGLLNKNFRSAFKAVCSKDKRSQLGTSRGTQVTAPAKTIMA